MKKLFGCLIACCAMFSMTAQERYFDERYISTQAFLNPILINPGAAGKDYYHHLLVNYRSKWAGFESAPKSFALSYDGPIGNNVGVGAMLVTDKAGYLETTKGQLSFSYTLASPTNKVGIGLSAEYLKHGVSGDVLNNELINQTDPYLIDRLNNGAPYFGAGFGVYGKYNNQITYGISLPSLLSARLADRDPSPAATYSDTNFGYIINAGYIFRPQNSDVEIEPSIFYKGLNNVPSHIDINVLMRFLDEKFTGGVTYTINADERLGFLIGARVNSFNFYYSYNVSRNDFQTYNNGSHEFTLRMDIGRLEGEEGKKLEMGPTLMDDGTMKAKKTKKNGGVESELEKSKRMLEGNG